VYNLLVRLRGISLSFILLPTKLFGGLWLPAADATVYRYFAANAVIFFISFVLIQKKQKQRKNQGYT